MFTLRNAASWPSSTAFELPMAFTNGAPSRPDDMLRQNGTITSRNENRPKSAGGRWCRKTSEATKWAPETATGPMAVSP